MKDRSAKQKTTADRLDALERQQKELLLGQAKILRAITDNAAKPIDKAVDVMQRELFKPFFAMFSALLENREGMMINRTKDWLPRYWETVEKQRQSPASTLECMIFASNFFWASETNEIREGMVTYLDRWILYLAYPTEAVRNQVKEMFETYVGSIIRSGLLESASQEERENSLALARRCYLVLKNGLLELKKTWKSSSRDGQSPYGYILSQYFDVFKQVVITVQDKKEFTSYFPLFFEMLASSSELRLNNSEDVRALILFWHKMCEDLPENYTKIVHDQRVRDVFNHIFISTDGSEHNMKYHKSFLPKYFDMVLYCFKQSPVYRKSYLENSSFTWVIEIVVLGAHRTYLCEELKELFRLSLVNVEIRRLCWTLMTPAKIEVGPALEIGAMLWQHCNRSDLISFMQPNAGLDPCSPIEMFSSLVISCPQGHYEQLASAMNVMQGFTSQWNQLASERSFGESIFQCWKNKGPFIGTLVWLLNMNVPELVFQTAISILRNIVELQHAVASSLQVPLVGYLINAHIAWVRALVTRSITRDDLHRAFFGSRSVFTKYIDNCIIDQRARHTMMRTDGIHAYRGLMLQLTQEERQSVLKDFYEPYYDLICDLCNSLIRLGRAAEVVKLVTLVTIEALPVRTDGFFEVISLILKSQTNNDISPKAIFMNGDDTRPLVEEILFNNAEVLWKDDALCTVETVINTLDFENRKLLMISTTVTNFGKHISDLRQLLESTSTDDISDRVHSVIGHLRAVNVSLLGQLDLSLASISTLIKSLQKDLEYLQSEEVIEILGMSDDLAAILDTEIQRTLCQLDEIGLPSAA